MAKLGEIDTGNRACGFRASRDWPNATSSTSGPCTCCCTEISRASFTEADNSKVLPTDTMKNTVYFVARNSKADTIEDFAMELGDYFLDNNPQVTKVSIDIEEKSWERMMLDGAADATTFKMGGPELQTVQATHERGGAWAVTSGVDGLTILKTTKSAFTGYIKDKLTTLKPATDRIFGTRATVEWDYAPGSPDYA